MQDVLDKILERLRKMSDKEFDLKIEQHRNGEIATTIRLAMNDQQTISVTREKTK